ncbi:MAG: hypothetical protein PHQ59_03845 [Candidatus Daviesbacteria bacterium]|nr:hypothetical protein [Candidatus Daviesbacteria bacterium]
MNRLNPKYRKVLKKSIFGQLFMLWTSPIDNTKMDITKISNKTKSLDNWFPNSLIISQKSKSLI